MVTTLCSLMTKILKGPSYLVGSLLRLVPTFRYTTVPILSLSMGSMIDRFSYVTRFFPALFWPEFSPRSYRVVMPNHIKYFLINYRAPAVSTAGSHGRMPLDLEGFHFFSYDGIIKLPSAIWHNPIWHTIKLEPWANGFLHSFRRPVLNGEFHSGFSKKIK